MKLRLRVCVIRFFFKLVFEHWKKYHNVGLNKTCTLPKVLYPSTFASSFTDLGYAITWVVSRPDSVQARRSDEHESVLCFSFPSDLSFVGAQSRPSCGSFKSVTGGMINDDDALQYIKKKQNICKIALGGHEAAYSCMQNCDEIIAQACAGGRQHTGKNV